MPYFRVSDALLPAMSQPDCKALDVRVYLWLCYRRQTHARDSFEASLTALAGDLGLIVKTGPQQGRPDAARMARALRSLEKFGLIERKRKRTKTGGNQPTRIKILDQKMPVAAWPRVPNSAWTGLPTSVSVVKRDK